MPSQYSFHEQQYSIFRIHFLQIKSYIELDSPYQTRGLHAEEGIGSGYAVHLNPIAGKDFQQFFKIGVLSGQTVYLLF